MSTKTKQPTKQAIKPHVYFTALRVKDDGVHIMVEACVDEKSITLYSAGLSKKGVVTSLNVFPDDSQKQAQQIKLKDISDAVEYIKAIPEDDLKAIIETQSESDKWIPVDKECDHVVGETLDSVLYFGFPPELFPPELFPPELQVSKGNDDDEGPDYVPEEDDDDDDDHEQGEVEIEMDYKPIEQISYDQAYKPSYYNTSLDLDELDVLRKPLIDNIARLNLSKNRLRSDEYKQLTNYHHYALNILNNMQNIKKVEMSNPYNQNMKAVTGENRGNSQSGIETINPYETQLKVIYDNKGRTQIVSQDETSDRYRAEWESQFDNNIMNPPSYIMPPSNVWNLPQSR